MNKKRTQADNSQLTESDWMTRRHATLCCDADAILDASIYHHLWVYRTEGCIGHEQSIYSGRTLILTFRLIPKTKIRRLSWDLYGSWW